MNKKILASFMSLVAFTYSSLPTFAATDPSIVLDPVQNVYEGREQAGDMIRNLDFDDISSSFWAREAIVRMGALNIIKGYDGRYNPSNSVSNQEALAFILRGLGLEEEAQLQAEILSANNQESTSTLDLWSRGYLQVAFQRGLIDFKQLTDAMIADQSQLDPAVNFMRGQAATREQIAEWIVEAINSTDPNLLQPMRTQQKVFEYVDWEQIDPDKIKSVEAVTTNQIMNGKPGSIFDPKGYVTRAEMAQVLKNMDDIYYDVMNIERKSGVIGSIEDQNDIGAGNSTAKRVIKIRTEDGAVDEIIYEIERDPIGQQVTKDAVTYRAGSLGGLLDLQTGVAVEYLVESEDNKILYIYQQGQAIPHEVKGVLQPLDGVGQGKITVQGSNRSKYTFQMRQGLYGTDEGTGTPYIMVDDKKFLVNQAPVSREVTLTIQNNIVMDIKAVGGPIVAEETRGIVKENALNYITIINPQNDEETKYFYRNQVQVEKQQYYDSEDEIGYIDEVFPDFRYDPRDTIIEDIEPGDIVWIQLDPENPNYISSISAKTNYIMKYGKVKEISSKGVLGTRMRIEYEDLRTSVLDIPNNIYISKDGKKISMGEIMPGDWVKVLVNQAVLDPGHVIESVKEIVVEGQGHYISNIYRGQLLGIDSIQRQLKLQNGERLLKTGWDDYKQLISLDLSLDDEVEYYEDGKRISLDYAQHYLTRHDGEVYIATEEFYDKERVKKVTFRHERDQVLSTDDVVYADGTGSFRILHESDVLNTDTGTIVRRHGRLVDAQNIMVPDYAQVVVNGENRAAIIDIKEKPSMGDLQIFRGRIQTIDEGRQFEVQSFSILQDMTWSFYPIPRIFTIDYNTRFYDENGLVDSDSFMDFTDQSKIDEVYTIVVDGEQALYVVDNPYVREGASGEIYEINEGSVMIKDTRVYDGNRGRWNPYNPGDTTLEVTIPSHMIIIKNGKVISSSALEKGDKIRVMTNINIADPANGALGSVEGYILYVEG